MIETDQLLLRALATAQNKTLEEQTECLSAELCALRFSMQDIAAALKDLKEELQ